MTKHLAAAVYTPAARRAPAWSKPVDNLNESALTEASLTDAAVSLWDLTAEQVRQQIASTQPAPGGGATSIIAATFGLALVHKGIIVSLKRKDADAVKLQKLSDMREAINPCFDALTAFADADSQAYQSYMNARSLPHDNSMEQSARASAMEKALLLATRVPLGAATEMHRGLELTETTIPLIEKHLLSDVFAGTLLLRAGLQGVLLNVGANVAGICDLELRKQLQQERIEIENAVELLFEAISQVYQMRISVS